MIPPSMPARVKVPVRLVGVLVALLAPTAAGAQQAPPPSTDAAEVAKKLSNPIADLVSVPFQFNWEQGVGPNEQTRFILNIQPVLPFALNDDWNMIARVIVPLVGQPPLFEGGSPASGVSDVLTSFFFSPSGEGLTWGVGPVISLPSTTESTLGTEKWSAGPTVVVLKQAGPWTYGMLWNQIWSFAGNSERNDVSQMFLQPFLAYTTANLWTFTLQSETTANWEAEDDQWTVPINVLASKLASFGPFPASYQFGFGVFAERPELAPSWKIRSAIVLVLPRR
jgi:hypothetical protein